MSNLEYLGGGLLLEGKLRDDLEEPVESVAGSWAEKGVDPAEVEILAEILARWAAGLGEARITDKELLEGVAWVEPSEEVSRLLGVAATEPLDRLGLAALAIHLVDIAETVALRVFVAELPALSAKADRSGGAARNVGLARHLKG